MMIEDVLVPNLFRIRKVKKETSDIFSLHLLQFDEQSEFQFLPGQFNMLYAFGSGEVAISISGRGENAGELIHTIRKLGSTTALLSHVQVGQVVGLRGPFGKPWPVQEAVSRNVVVVAGGIGLAPLRTLLRYFAKNRDQFKKITLIYGARTPHDLLYADELELWRKNANIQIELTVDAVPETCTKPWTADVGIVTSVIQKISLDDPTDIVAYLCGPEVMMHFASQELIKRGILSEQIYISMERHMNCAVGFCGRCQFGEHFVCKDGPVFKYSVMKELLQLKEL
jgi:NAD(P)H-flavin reductase